MSPSRGTRVFTLGFAGMLAVIPGLVGCWGGVGSQVVVYTSVDQVFSEPIFNYCGDRTGLDVRAVFDTEETKSTGVLNRLLAEANQPRADLFWSGDPVRPFVLIQRGMVQPYVSPMADGIPLAFRDPDGTWTGFGARARVLLVNTDLVSGDAMPASVRDLADGRWQGRTAMANPLFGTTTIHVAALFDAWGTEETRRFLDSLKENRVQIASSNGEVGRLVVSGEAAFGLTDTDDAYQAIQSGAPVAVVFPDQDGMGTLLMPTAVVLMKGASHQDAGKRLLDCLLGSDVEWRLAEAAAHMPLRIGAETPTGLRSASSIRAMNVDHARLAQTMTTVQPWLREWVGF